MYDDELGQGWSEPPGAEPFQADDLVIDDRPPLEQLEPFSPEYAMPLLGDPGSDMASWHEQQHPDTCAIVAQEFVLESLTGQEFDEAELTQLAEEHGSYQPGAGTPVSDMNALLTLHGVASETHVDGTFGAIEQALAGGNKVIVSVDGEELHVAPDNQWLDDVQDTIPGQGADHAVEVTGVVQTAEGTMVVINDPGAPDGGGCMVSIDQFESAWADSGNVMVVAGPTADPSHDELGGDELPGSLS